MKPGIFTETSLMEAFQLKSGNWNRCSSCTFFVIIFLFSFFSFLFFFFAFSFSFSFTSVLIWIKVNSKIIIYRYLFENQLNGTLPTEIGMMTSLRYAYLLLFILFLFYCLVFFFFFKTLSLSLSLHNNMREKPKKDHLRA